MRSSIAIVGLACVYPDARTPLELWENVLAQRRAFRRLPSERLRAEDYWSADRNAPDRSYSVEGAVIEGYQFDRLAFRVAGNTFRSADLAHWLALDVAAKALADAGFPEGRGLPRETTGVLLGNTLTGEFSRANSLRLRWPYVRRVVEAALAEEGWQPKPRRAFLERLEADYKAPFPPVGEESLAGNLSNTIAGRICNQFDLKGGGYTVDGACASSLLAVANACTALMAGDLDLALAGGVDLSLDPFELVGFAKSGALASDEMRVFDRGSAGFWPGEGCGFVVLMRQEEALAQGCRVYAVIRGWGISSDGSGGITRPEAEGQLQALRRAYRRAGFGADTVAYFEGHGTGTAVGDAAELEVLTRARQEAQPGAPPAAIGSIKANIGHTKAAAGIAGLLKATMAVHAQILPPTTGCEQPHPQFEVPTPALRVLREAEAWPDDRPLRAGVSAMGFGGINAHLVLECAEGQRRQTLSPRERSLGRSHQDAELFLLAGAASAEVAPLVDKLLALAAGLSRAELTDLAAHLQKTLGEGSVRAAVIASKPAELAERLRVLKSWLEKGISSTLQTSDGIFLASNDGPPRIAFLFPGQGSPTNLDGGIWPRRFETVRELYQRADLPAEGDCISTRLMQPAVVTASLAGLNVLSRFGLEADAAIGHSLGELTALHWAGAISEETLLRVARVRGQAMAELGSPTGAMLAIDAPWPTVQAMLDSEELSIVGFNSPRQTVVAGQAVAIGLLAQRAAQAGWQTSRLAVSHAFHTQLVAAAVPVLAEQLVREHFSKTSRAVVSTITGAPLEGGEDLRRLLCRQVTAPVRFASALAALLGGHEGRAAPNGAVDLFIEVGPGLVLSGLVRDTTDLPVVALDAGSPSLKGLLRTLGAAFALGAPLRHSALFEDRFTRPFTLDWKPKFFVNPCELAPTLGSAAPSPPTGNGHSPLLNPDEPVHGTRNTEHASPITHLSRRSQTKADHAPVRRSPAMRDGSRIMATVPTLELIRELVADCAELPVASVRNDYRMLSDLHLNSITVGRLVSAAAHALGLPRFAGLTEFANASVAEVARALDEFKRCGATGPTSQRRQQPAGVGTWFRRFTVELVEATKAAKAPPKPAAAEGSGWLLFTPRNHPLGGRLRQRLAKSGSSGVLVWLPEHPAENDLELLLGGARAAMAMKREPRFVLVQHGWGGAGFARTLHLENHGQTTCVVNVPRACPAALEWIVGEALGASGYAEAHYDAEGRRREPRLRLAPLAGVEAHAGKSPGSDGPDGYPIGATDVLLVTGGGKGIAAECALALGRATGASLALVGRSDPQEDRELAQNLARMAAAGARCRYFCADVTDAATMRRAVLQIEKQFGPVTALLHGAGTNTPRLIEALDEATFRRTLAPKVQGLRNALAALDRNALRLLVTFGSIIARAGFRGEADYATANEWLTAMTEEFQAGHSQCRCLALEWSVWSGVGMGERLGRLESLIQQGITPIPVDEGVRLFLECLRQGNSGAVVISGRLGELPTLKLAETELPLRRFLERKRVYYPGVELIADVELSVDADPYLNDHVLQNQRLFPAVLGLEAMAQVAMALADAKDWPNFEQVELTRPVGVSDKAPTTIRLAALRRGPELVEVCLRAEETDFQVDHFRALCRFDHERLTPAPAPEGRKEQKAARSPWEDGRVSLDPQAELYGQILFHQGRFRRLLGYRLVKAKECIAEIAADDGAAWFGAYFPGQLVLGDPAARDAALHAIQASIPHQRILPTGIDRVVIQRIEPGAHLVRARERARDGNNFIYDLEVANERGEVIEVWEGLRLRAVETMGAARAWPEALLAPYVERRLEELTPRSGVSVAFGNGGGARRPGNRADDSPAKAAGRLQSSDALMQQALGKAQRIWRRPDGKPTAPGAAGIAAAHCCGFTLAVAGKEGLACDIEQVTERPDEVWRDLLGEERFSLAERVALEQGEDTHPAATRLWTAMECMKKAGLPAQSPLVLDARTADGWVILRSGTLTIATCLTSVRGKEGLLVIAVAFDSAPSASRLDPACAGAS